MDTEPQPMKTPGPVSTARVRERAAARLAEFRELRSRGALCSAVTERFAAEASDALIGAWAAQTYLEDAVTLMAEIATLDEPCSADPGQRPPFPPFVERLSDSFDPALCDLYERAFVQMIAMARRLPAGAKLDAALNHFGLHHEEDLLRRKAALGTRGPWREKKHHHEVRKALVLSRVTLGADVAITSIVIQKARRLFPDAECILLAPAKAAELFGGDVSLAIRPVSYHSGGTLLERLASWLDLLDAVRAEIGDLPAHEYVVLDPDSRYLQLGLLPVLRDESRYFFFESRRAGSGGSANLSRLTNEWMNDMFGGPFGGNDTFSPRLALRKQDTDSGVQLWRRLGEGGASHVVAMSFGVGGNIEKRLTDSFEERVVARLIADGATIVLDQGAGEEEAERAQRIAESVRSRADSVATLSAGSPDSLSRSPLHCKLLTWHGGIGAWAGVIAASDAYIGYDSAGQHLAAALGIPAIDIFMPSASPRFRQRWQPGGGTRALVPDGSADSSQPDAFLEKVLAAHRDIRSNAGGIRNTTGR
jgi:ADP-heptose:LPS heptosyltransferase